MIVNYPGDVYSLISCANDILASSFFLQWYSKPTCHCFFAIFFKLYLVREVHFASGLDTQACSLRLIVKSRLESPVCPVIYLELGEKDMDFCFSAIWTQTVSGKIWTYLTISILLTIELTQLSDFKTHFLQVVQNEMYFFR